MARLKNLLAALLAALLLALPAWALDVPPLAGRVNDLAGIMRAETVQALTEKLAAQEAENGVQIAVLTIPGLQGENLEEFALKTASTWQLGQQGKDNGALLLVAVAEREVRIETGQGMEDRLTDLLAGRIIRNEIVPAFRNGDYDSGIARGVEAMMAAAQGQYDGGSDVGDETLDESIGILAFLSFIAGIFSRRKFWHTLLAGAAAGTLAWLMYADAGLEPWGFIFLGVLGALLFSAIARFVVGFGSAVTGGGDGFSSGDGGFSSSGGFSSRGGGFSSGGGGFSGGGGSFGGGGASGKW